MLTRRATPRAQEELNQMVAEIDADNSGEIDFDGAPPVHRIIPRRIPAPAAQQATSQRLLMKDVS